MEDKDNKSASAAAYAAALKELSDRTPERLGTSSAEDFSKALQSAMIPSDATESSLKKAALTKANITPYTSEDYSKFKTFLSADKQSGYAVKPGSLTEAGTDELVSVFSKPKGRGAEMLQHAVDVGGAKQLDAFDIGGKLPKLYGSEFKETSRMKFDPQYAPNDWDYQRVGTPDVIGMQLDESKNATRLARQKEMEKMAKFSKVLKVGLPAVALAGMSDAETFDEGLMNTIIPGGVSQLGADRGDEAALLGEVQGYKNYQTSEARKNALKNILRNRK
jgi:hypothetical protein